MINSKSEYRNRKQIPISNVQMTKTVIVFQCQKTCLDHSNLDDNVIKYGSSPKELIQIKDSRIPGFQDSSAMLKYYEELNVRQKVVYTLFAYL